ncbi:MAG: M57 family metalloprotease [Bacteroidota bacterium]
MKKELIYIGLTVVMAGTLFSCKKAALTETNPNVLNQDELNMIAAAGFNSNWAEKSGTGNYLIEGDIYLSKDQLTKMAGAETKHNFIVADEEHYRTYNVVSTPTGSRVITVSMSIGFPSYYYTALDKALARYNSYGLKITFQKVETGGNIVVTGTNLGTSGGGCILGQASGFPDASGNPSKGFTLSTSSCATTYLNTEAKADEVIAHEIGHCIGFRHTDYKRRNSCGPGAGESAGSIGAVHILGTPTNVSGSYDSWMMACTNGSAAFNGDDGIALNYVY